MRSSSIGNVKRQRRLDGHIRAVLAILLVLCSEAAAIFGGPDSNNLLGNFLSSKGEGSSKDSKIEGEPQRQTSALSSIPPPPGKPPPRPPLVAFHGGGSPQQQEGQLPPPPPPKPTSADDQSGKQQQQQQRAGGDKEPPPPPPQVPFPQDHQKDDPSATQQQQQQQSSYFEQPPPPPGSGAWGAPLSEEGGSPVWMPPPPFWQSQQPPPFTDESQPPQFWSSPEQEWEQARQLQQREQDLVAQLQNLTTHCDVLLQREEMHLRQVDALTERVLQVETASAHDQLLVQEYQANCTQAAQQVAELQGELAQWQERCENWKQQHEQDEEQMTRLQEKVKEQSLKAEDLAVMVERHRLEFDPDSSEGGKRKQKKKKRRRGFFAWLFGRRDDEEEDEEEELDHVYKAARSTLLQALQTERSSVEELEAMVATLQQNNSAISAQVESRDLIIDELNDRVGVFEEDKVVLKAALRQLQKEMSEEAPKTQQLVDELQQARHETERLQEEMESLISTHQEELAALNHVLQDRQSTIQETESNLTVIGTYVDKLEERLADFAVARRDVQDRERQCQQLEQAVVNVEKERDDWKARVEEYEKEQEELKELLQELVQERTRLRDDIGKLAEERDGLHRNSTEIQATLVSRQGELQKLRQLEQQWKSQIEQLESELAAAKSANAELRMSWKGTESSTIELRRELEATQQSQQKIQEALQQSETTRKELENQLSRLQEEEASRRRDETPQLKEALRRSEEAQNSLRSKLSFLEEKLRRREPPPIPKQPPATRTSAVVSVPGAPDTNVSSSVGVVTSPKQPESVLPPPPLDKPLNATATNATLASPPGQPRSVVPPPPSRQLLNATGRVPPRIATTTDQRRQLLNRTAALSQPVKKGALVPSTAAPPVKRKVPLRKIRKFFSKTTGIHGVFTPPSRKRPPPRRVAAHGSPNSATGPRGLARGPGRPPFSTKGNKRSFVLTSSKRPDMIAHTLSGLKSNIPSWPKRKDKKT